MVGAPPSEFAIIVLDDGPQVQTCRAGSARIFARGRVPIAGGLEQSYAVGQMLLNRAEDFGHCGIQPAAVSVDYGFSDHPDFDMTILGQAHEQ